MRWLIPCNTVLLVLSGVYCGSVLTAERWPIAAALATVSFLAAVATPIVSAYLSLGGGFRQLEGQYMESRRRRDRMAPKIEVFGAPPPAPSFRGPGTARRTLLVFMLIGIVLLAYDASDWALHRPPPPPAPGVISNF